MPLSNAIKAAAPWPLRKLIRRARARRDDAEQRALSPRDVFTRAYEHGAWQAGAGLPEGEDAFYSGPGADDYAAEPYAERVNALIRAERVLSVVDLGCGDFRVGRRIASQPVHYMGVDVVEPLIQANRARHKADNVCFRCLDIVADELPKAELCLVREVLQHLSNAQIFAILPKLRRYRWVVVTELQLAPAGAARSNRDKPQGAHTRLLWDSYVDLGVPPFSVPNMQLMLSVPVPRRDDPRPAFINSFLIRNNAS